MNQPLAHLEWIGVDWGSSLLRIWAMNAAGEVLDSILAYEGASTLDASDFEAVLSKLLTPWLQTLDAGKRLPVLIAGMAGSRQGWKEALYLSLPINLREDLHLTEVKTDIPQVDVYLIPGLKQTQPADVMRGEETQLLGFLKETGAEHESVILPGTHSKWVKIDGGNITQFTTCMTGELYHLFSRESVLRHSMSEDYWSQMTFDQAFLKMYESPASFSQLLFSLRAMHLLEEADTNDLSVMLSGYLLGLEFKAMEEASYLKESKQVTLIGNAHLCGIYQQAAAVLGISTRVFPGDAMVLQGEHHIYLQQLKT